MFQFLWWFFKYSVKLYLFLLGLGQKLDTAYFIGALVTFIGASVAHTFIGASVAHYSEHAPFNSANVGSIPVGNDL